MATMSADMWRVEEMTASDLDEVLAIERQSHPTAWPRALFEGELRLSWSRLKVLRHVSTGEILGFVDYWLVYDELHVLNIAVAPSARRSGCGRFLMNLLLEDGRAHDVEYVTLEVRITNEAAISLYERMGFVEVGRRRGYYTDTGEDALILALEMDPESHGPLGG